MRPPRIIIVNDEPYLVEAMDLMVHTWFKDANVLPFTAPEKALEELQRADPDILILDDHMPRLHGFDIVEQLAAKGIIYPVIVTSGSSDYEPMKQWIQQMAQRGLKISCLSVPFTVEQLKEELAKHLGAEAKT